jgi:hypothetical protein
MVVVENASERMRLGRTVGGIVNVLFAGEEGRCRPPCDPETFPPVSRNCGPHGARAPFFYQAYEAAS